MDDSRLTKRIFMWDKELNDRNLVSAWCKEIKNIFRSCNLNDFYANNYSLDITNVVSDMKEKFKIMQNNYLSTE
jgi:hypothetical protein